MGKHEILKLGQLNIWTDNPRISQERITNENDAIKFIFEIVGRDKMVNLMEDVSTRNLDGNKQPTVVFNKKIDKYDVYDGNRRVTALKSIALKNEYGLSIENKNNISLNSEIFVYVTTHDEAMELLLRDHAGEQEGVGQISWDSFERDYHLVKMGHSAFYSNAYKVSKICELRRKSDFRIINYTELDTVFKNARIKEIFGVKDWDFDEDEFIKFTYALLKKYKPTSYSRFLPELKRDENIPRVKKFIKNLTDEVKREKDVLAISLSNSSIYVGSDFQISWINIGFNKQGIDSSKCVLKYVTPKGDEKDFLDTNITGTWKIHAEYKDTKCTKNFIVKKFEKIVINPRKNQQLEINNSYDFQEFLISATNSIGENIDSLIEINFYDINRKPIYNGVDKNTCSIVFDNEGAYIVEFIYKDPISGEVATIYEQFEVKNPLLEFHELDTIESGYFHSNIIKEDVNIEFNYVINKLIKGLNNIYVDQDKVEVFAAALRSLIESIIDLLGEKNPIFLKNNEGKTINSLEKKIDKFYDIIYADINSLSTKISNGNYSKHPSYLTIKNIINQYEKSQYTSLVSMLHLGAHKSTQCIDVDSLESKKQLISLIVELSFLYLELY